MLDACEVEARACSLLAQVKDPCSIAAGVPAGLFEMGMVGKVCAVPGEAGATLSVSLILTHPGCAMAAVFLAEAHRCLGTIPGVSHVNVSLEATVWTPDRLAPAYASKLADLDKSGASTRDETGGQM